MTITRRCHRGVTMIEMLGVLILLSAFALIATRLFTSTMKITAAAGQTHDRVVGLENALSALRQDMWTARKIEAPNPVTAQLTAADDRAITWTIERGRLLRSVAAERDYWTVPNQASFTSDGVTLVLRLEDGASAGGFGQFTFASQPRLMEKLTTP